MTREMQASQHIGGVTVVRVRTQPAWSRPLAAFVPGCARGGGSRPNPRAGALELDILTPLYGSWDLGGNQMSPTSRNAVSPDP